MHQAEKATELKPHLIKLTSGNLSPDLDSVGAGLVIKFQWFIKLSGAVERAVLQYI